MPAELLLGRPVVDAMLLPLADEPEHGLAVIQVGSTPESDSYVKQAKNTAKRMPNLAFTHLHLSRDATREELRDAMRACREDPHVHGCMLQLPLPPHLHPHLEEIRDWMAPEKDVDLLGTRQRGLLTREKRPNQIVPPTPYAVMKLLQYYDVEVRGKIAAVVGDGEVGALLKIMLGNDKATQIVCNDKTPDVGELTRLADIVVGCCAAPDSIRGDRVKPGATVVNVGMREVHGTLRGDVHVESVRERAARVTPVLGGLGPVTVAALIQNVFRAGRNGSGGK